MQANNPLISVIIPVYNSEKYLRKCLDSLVFQTYNNLEIICINDGSKDNSLDILNEYAKKDKRVKVFSQKNKGQGAARNLGIRKAAGNYISFIDSDDWVYLTLYQTFVDTVNKIAQPIDIWMYNISSYFQDANDLFRRQVVHIKEWENHTSELTIHNYGDCRAPFVNNISACNKILNAKFLKRLKLFFPEGLMYEDQYFSAKVLLNAKSIVINNATFYRYRNVNSGSAMTTKTEKVFDIFKITEMIEEELNNLGIYEYYKYHLFKYKYLSYFNCFFMCPDELKEKYFNIMKHILINMEMKYLDINIINKFNKVNIYHLIRSSDYNTFCYRIQTRQF